MVSMKKTFGALLSLFIIFFPSICFAQVRPEQNAPPPQTSLPFGQNHYYTVTLRGNGQAVVYLKTIFSNTNEASLSAVQITFPQTPQTFAVFQAHREPQCLFYKPLPANNSISQPDDCQQYQEPDYLYGWGNTTYHKAQYIFNGNTATITLPKSIHPNGNGSLVIAYVSPYIAKKNIFGAYQFTFETAKINEIIQSLQVGINTDTDYYLKGAKAGINYQQPDVSRMPSAESFAGGSISSTQFDQVYNQIGQGNMTKSATNLQPSESYTVKGVYANSKIKLYGKELIIGSLLALVILTIAVFGLYWAVKKMSGLKSKTQTENQQSSVKNKTFIAVIGASFGASIFIVLYTFGLYLFSSYFGQMFQFYSYNFAYPILLILLTIISLSIYSVFLFVPGVFIGLKRSIAAGVLTIVLTILWLVIHGIVLTGIFFLFFQKTYPQPIPYAQPFGSTQDLRPMDMMKKEGAIASPEVQNR